MCHSPHLLLLILWLRQAELQTWLAACSQDKQFAYQHGWFLKGRERCDEMLLKRGNVDFIGQFTVLL